MEQLSIGSGEMMAGTLNNYDLADVISQSEIARLLDQDCLLNEDMGCLFPPDLDLSLVRRVLDIACGPGGWAIEAARAHPAMDVIGIDIRQPLIAHAQFRATVLEQENVHFLLMDATKPFTIPHMAFDIVHVRMINSLLTTEQWPVVLANMLNATCRGGYLHLTESIAIETNSMALKHLHELLFDALRRAGRSPYIDAEGQQASMGVRLPVLLTQAGCNLLGSQVYHMDWSWGTPTHAIMYRNVLLFMHLLKPFVVQKMQVISEKKYDQLYHSMQLETYRTNFTGMWSYCSIWGQKSIGLHKE